ncbi:hypothetical protein SISNIDRAFT_388367, partial [Sistotremastrum niveocremeum HHB9708]
SPTELSAALYGFSDVWHEPLHVSVAGACTSTPAPRATAAIFVGPNAALNMAVRIPGKQTHMRASLCAIALALLTLPRDRSLVISYDNAAIYKTLLSAPGPDSERGWTGANSDVVLYIISLIRAR